MLVMKKHESGAVSAPDEKTQLLRMLADKPYTSHGMKGLLVTWTTPVVSEGLPTLPGACSSARPAMPALKAASGTDKLAGTKRTSTVTAPTPPSADTHRSAGSPSTTVLVTTPKGAGVRAGASQRPGGS